MVIESNIATKIKAAYRTYAEVELQDFHCEH